MVYNCTVCRKVSGVGNCVWCTVCRKVSGVGNCGSGAVKVFERMEYMYIAGLIRQCHDPFRPLLTMRFPLEHQSVHGENLVTCNMRLNLERPWTPISPAAIYTAGTVLNNLKDMRAIGKEHHGKK